eukprot:4894763-Alexandrium_andersonii.AAC.1
MPRSTDPAMPMTLAVPCWSKPVASTVSWSRQRHVATRRATPLTTAPRQEWSSTTRPVALAALRMAAFARHRLTKVFTGTGASSMKAGGGARLAEKAAATT